MALDITDTDVYTAVKAFIALIVPTGTEIRQGQQNRVPMPSAPFVLMTAVGPPQRIGTNQDGTELVGASYTASVTADYRYSIQVDFYGPDGETWAMSAELLWRDGIAFDSMPSNIKPLYSENHGQTPIIAAENQWIQRWSMTLVLDYQPTWTQATETAGTLTAGLVPIEVNYPD